MQTLSKSYYQALNCRVLPQAELRDAWTNEIFQQQSQSYYKNTLLKDKVFLTQVLQLFEATDNLKLSERSVHSMLEPLLSSVGGSKLISALLQERNFLLNMVKAMLLPGTPTLAMLTGGKVKTPSSNASKNDQPSQESILSQYNYLFNRRENVQLNFNFKEQSDSDDDKADVGSDGSIEDLDRSLTSAQKPGFNGMANVRLTRSKKDKESNKNFNNQKKDKLTFNENPSPRKPQIVVKKQVEIPQFEVITEALDSPVAQAYKRMSKPKAPTQDNNLTMTAKSNNTSMVKGNYPTSTSTALEVSQKPDTKTSQKTSVNQDMSKGANQKKKTTDFVIDQPQNSRPRQPVVFTQDYMHAPYVRVEKKIGQEVKQQEIQVEPPPQQKNPQPTVAFSFLESETKQSQVAANAQDNKRKNGSLKAVVEEPIFERIVQKDQTNAFTFTEIKPLTQPSANQQHNYMELPKNQPQTNQSSPGKSLAQPVLTSDKFFKPDKLTGRGVEFDFNFQNTDTYNVTEDQQTPIGDEDDFFEGKLTNITQARESEVAEQIDIMNRLKEGVHRIVRQKSVEVFVDTRLIRKQSSAKAEEVKRPAQQMSPVEEAKQVVQQKPLAEEVKQPAQQRPRLVVFEQEYTKPPSVVFEQKYTKAEKQLETRKSENEVKEPTQQNPQLVVFEPVDMNGFEGLESAAKQNLWGSFSEETTFEQPAQNSPSPRRNVFDEEFNKIKQVVRLQSEQKLLSEPKKFEQEVKPETEKKSNKSSIYASSQQQSSQAEEVVLPEQEWGQLDFQPSSSSSSSKEEQEEEEEKDEDIVSGESIDENKEEEQDEIVKAALIEARQPSEPISVKEEEPRLSTAKERRNIFNAGSDSEYGTNRNKDELNLLNNAEEDLFNDLHQFEL